MKRILIIDDDIDICSLLKRFLSKNEFNVEVAHSGKAGLELLKKTNFDAVLCDFRLPDKDGLDMIKEIREIQFSTQIIIITGYSDVRMAVNVIKKGAFQYVTKPIHPEEILLTVQEAVAKSYSQTEDVEITEATPSKQQRKRADFHSTSSAYSKGIQKLIDLVAPTNMTVMIIGESGTGKEVTAKAIHQASDRSDKKFIAVDCGAIPKELAGSELFGHIKGSFTGALTDKIGHFEAANGGTLFLDEIGNLSYDNQIKLLRVLQERKVRKIGATDEKDIDVRILVATNEDLKQMVSKGTFREDLYYRINEFKIELSPLRERKSDIVEFANFMLAKSSDELNKTVNEFSEGVIQTFKNYPWPGNLREMQNVVKRSTLLATSVTVEMDQIPEEIKSPEFYAQLSGENDDDFEINDLKQVAEEAEKRAILRVLGKTGFNKSKTAKILKVDRKTLYNKITAYGIELPN